MVISPLIGKGNFKCGIGIDYGTMRVIKVGVPRRGQEASPNRGLVWAGAPANIASRLTDRANKSITETVYDITYKPINPAAVTPTGWLGMGPLVQSYYRNRTGEPLYLSSLATKTITEGAFAQMFVAGDNGNSYFTSGGQLVTFKRREKTTIYPGILMTEAVLKGLMAEKLSPQLYGPRATWVEEVNVIPNVNVRVYGGDFTWQL